MSELKTIIANRLKSAREAARLTQGDVADALGIERASYTQIEIGNNMLKVEHLVKLPEILHQPVHYFLGLPGPSDITPDESEALELFRSLPNADARRMALVFLRGWAEQLDKQRKQV